MGIEYKKKNNSEKEKGNQKNTSVFLRTEERHLRKQTWQ